VVWSKSRSRQSEGQGGRWPRLSNPSGSRRPLGSLTRTKAARLLGERLIVYSIDVHSLREHEPLDFIKVSLEWSAGYVYCSPRRRREVQWTHNA
jgi:hypothetical protein